MMEVREGDAVPEWSVVTVTFNSASRLSECWNFDLPAWLEWIVVDNASGDLSASMAESGGATVVRLPDNVGFAKANNIGVERSLAPNIAIVNPDVHGNWEDLRGIAEHLTQATSVAAPFLRNADGSDQPNGRGAPRLRDKMLSRLAPSAARSVGYHRIPSGVLPARVWWVTGAAAMMSRQTWNRLGGFDERFFLYHEDVDLCIRAWRAGIPVEVLPAFRWSHRWERAASGLKLRHWRLELGSLLRFYRKYPRLLLQPIRRLDPDSRLIRRLAP